MERKDFLRGVGLAGLGLTLPLAKVFSAPDNESTSGGCVLIPQETAGPYPLDLSSNSAMFRQDIRETQAGVQLNLKLKFLGVNNCGVMQNARVDVWHCSANGYYSGYTTNGQQGSQNHAGETFLRGIQMTDANGEVNFVTIFPGWYSGRIIHIHFQVFLSSVLTATSQLTFPVTEKNALLAANAPYSSYGPDPTTFASDNVFSDGYALQLATLTPSTSVGYDSYLEVTINGTGFTGLQELEPETGGQFKLGQNFPNPYSGETTVPFVLKNTSDVKLELWDLAGKKVASIIRKQMSAGEHKIAVNLKS